MFTDGRIVACLEDYSERRSSDGLQAKTAAELDALLPSILDMAFTKCPKCEAKTKQRKVPLVIHIEPGQMFVLNKTCRYCERCDLLIAQEADIEAMMAATFDARRPEIVGNEYLVIGTLDRADWRAGSSVETPARNLLDRVYVFEDEWHFEVDYGGWRPAES